MRPTPLLLLGCAGAAAAPHELVVGLRLRNADKLEKLFWRVSDPKSPEYLRHRSVGELAGLIGADDATIDQTKEWLRSLGAEEDSLQVSALRDTVTASIREPSRLAAASGWAAAPPPVAAAPGAADFVLRREAAAPPAPPTSSRRAHTTQFGPNIEEQKKAYGIPTDLAASNPDTLQMVWGPGTFGYSPTTLASFKKSQCPLLNTSKVKFDTKNHGSYGGDNFGEGQLDTKMISAFGLNVETLVSNTNTSSSTEEGSGFGQALLDFSTELASRSKLPHVLSMSLGSLSAYSCDLLCSEAAKQGHTEKECKKYMQEQRQVCMYLSQDQVGRINQAMQVLGVRGVSLFGASGDGGSHFSFGPFSGGAIADTLNKISCEFQIPIFPSPSPYMISVGGTSWQGGSSKRPKGWPNAGGGFAWQFEAPEHQKKSVAAYLSTTSGLPKESSFNASGRGYPDLACISSDGTSQSSPSLAGMFSLITDHRLNNGLPPLGFLGPRLWQRMEQYPGEAFEDITVGNTKLSCDNGFPAAKGWDPASGWGRPRWAGMMTHFGTDDTPPPPVTRYHCDATTKTCEEGPEGHSTMAKCQDACK